jgi:hypothetical protein
MLLGGLWHGAGWTFVIWGGLHGLYLVINHVWQVIAPRGRPTQIAMAIIGGPVTYIAVCIAWVFFRAESIAAAQNMLWAMLGGNGFDDLRAIMEPWWDISMLRWEDIALDYVAGAKRPAWSSELTLFVTCAVVTWCLPNIYQIFGSRSKAIDTYQQLSKWSWLRWSPNLAWALISALAFTASLIPLFSYENPSRFLYFQF